MKAGGSEKFRCFAWGMAAGSELNREKGDFRMWVEDGEKFAFVGLDVKTESLPPVESLPPHFWVFTDKTFELPRRASAGRGLLQGIRDL
jgi:hypothetical protein